jgi:hypothetical protein
MSLKRPSSTNQPPPNPPTFFTDRDLGNEVADALEDAGYTVRRHDAVFPDPKTKDPVWLARVGREQWAGLSHNKDIQRTEAELDVAMAEGAGVFFLIGKLTHKQLARNVIATLQVIIEFWQTHPRPFTAKIRRPEGGAEVIGIKPGTVELWMDRAGWLAWREARKERRRH